MLCSLAAKNAPQEGVDAHLRERLGRRLLGGRLGEDVHDGSTTASCSCVSSLRLRTEPPFLTSMMTVSNITAAQTANCATAPRPMEKEAAGPNHWRAARPGLNLVRVNEL